MRRPSIHPANACEPSCARIWCQKATGAAKARAVHVCLLPNAGDTKYFASGVDIESGVRSKGRMDRSRRPVSAAHGRIQPNITITNSNVENLEFILPKSHFGPCLAPSRPARNPQNCGPFRRHHRRASIPSAFQFNTHFRPIRVEHTKPNRTRQRRA